MLAIVRMHSRISSDNCWNHVNDRKDELQAAMGGKGLMLYMTRRVGKDDISLFVHVVEPDLLASFISGHLSRAKEVTGIWVITLLQAAFYPLPRDGGEYIRYTVSVRTDPDKAAKARLALGRLATPDSLAWAYMAYTFHQYDSSIAYSVLARDKFVIQEHLSQVSDIPEVTQTMVHLVEKSVPLVSHPRWIEYSSDNLIVPEWNEAHMLDQFHR